MISDRFHSAVLTCATFPSNRISIAESGYPIGMETEDLSSEGGRLRWARIRAGYTTAESAAKAARVNPVSFRAYENNQHGYSKHAVGFARKFGVPVEWLLEGGAMVPDVSPSQERAPAWLPSDVTLEALLEAALPDALQGPVSRERLQVAALAVGAAIRLLARRPESEGNPDAMKMVEARIAEMIAQPEIGKALGA